MTDSIQIPARFIGPPHSANGGYACGITARAGTHSAAEVSLRVPPPVERPLRLERGDGAATLYDGDELIAHSEPATVDVALPEPVTLAEAEKAAAGFDFDRYQAQHVFPGCFVDRAQRRAVRAVPRQRVLIDASHVRPAAGAQGGRGLLYGAHGHLRLHPPDRGRRVTPTPRRLRPPLRAARR